MKVYVFGSFNNNGHDFARHYRWDYSRRRPLQIWLDSAGTGMGTEGRAYIKKDARLGVTALDWTDRQGDTRPGSHTAVFVFADIGGEELLALAREQVPWAFRVEVTLQPWTVVR